MSFQHEIEVEQRLDLLHNISVRPNSEAERLCKQLITVIMCTFSTCKLSIVMNAICDYPERTKINGKLLSTKMNLSIKQCKDYLSLLKSGGFIIETTKKLHIQQKVVQTQNPRWRKFPKNRIALYHLDYIWFIMMIKLKFHQILVRLNSVSNTKSYMGDGYICSNEDCYLVFKVCSIMDLMTMFNNESNHKHNDRQEFHFICEECGQPLKDASKYYNCNNDKFNVKRQFNTKLKSVRDLLAVVEIAIIKEQEFISDEILRLQCEMNRMRNETGIIKTYEVQALDFNVQQKFIHGQEFESAFTVKPLLPHLMRISNGRIQKSKLVIKESSKSMSENVSFNELKIKNEDGRKTVKIEEDTEMIEKGIQFIKDIAQMGKINGMLKNGQYFNGRSDWRLKSLFVDGKSVLVCDILDSNSIQMNMTDEEFAIYDRFLVQYGLAQVY